jgi:acetate kinase
LLGLGGSSDMREIEARRGRGDVRAALAYDVFIHRARAAVGAMSAALHGLDAIAVLGGIGEHAAGVRADVCAAFGYAGVALDPEANAAPAGDVAVSSAGSRVRVLRIVAREDWTMALLATRA